MSTERDGTPGDKEYIYLHKDNAHRQTLLQQLFRHPSAVAFARSGILDKAATAAPAEAAAATHDREHRPAFRVLEIGCGSGWTTQDVARMLPSHAHITGLDANPDLIAAAQKRLQSETEQQKEEEMYSDRIEFVNMTGEEAASHYAGAFDAVWIRFVLIHIADPMAMLRAAKDCLRPGGILLVEDADALGDTSDPPIFANSCIFRAQSSAYQQLGGDLRRGYQIGSMLKTVGGFQDVHVDSYVPLFGKGLTITPWLGVEETPLGKWPSQEELFDLVIPFLKHGMDTLEPKLVAMKEVTAEDMKECRDSLDRVADLDYQLMSCRTGKVFQWWATKSSL